MGVTKLIELNHIGIALQIIININEIQIYNILKMLKNLDVNEFFLNLKAEHRS